MIFTKLLKCKAKFAISLCVCAISGAPIYDCSYAAKFKELICLSFGKNLDTKFLSIKDN